VRVLAQYERSDPAAAAARPLHLYLVGAERQPWVKKYEDAVEALAAGSDARGRIHVVDRTESDALTRAYYRASDVHALHASDESMPFVCMESMAMGLPQVATRVFGIPELVRDGQEGLIYDFRGNDTSELEGKLLTLVRDPELRARMGASGAQRIRADFTIAKMAAKYDAWYLQALTKDDEGGAGGES
jgi:glycosyltransferase involved in cell wall biosynthesis